MAVRFFLIVIVTLSLPAEGGDAFTRNCIPCHRHEKVSLRTVFMNALLVYGGRENMKAGLKYFLRHPDRDTSVMGEEYFRDHPLKKPLGMDEKELDEALGIFWEKYKVIGKLR